MSNIIEVYISQSDIPNWAFESRCWFKYPNGLLLYNGFTVKEQRQNPKMQECERTCLGAFISQASKQCFTLVHVLLLVRTKNLLILPANQSPFSLRTTMTVCLQKRNTQIFTQFRKWSSTDNYLPLLLLKSPKLLANTLQQSKESQMYWMAN